MKNTEKATAVREHSIGELRILSGDGCVTRRMTVFCDAREQVVEVAVCDSCAGRVGIRMPTSGASGSLSCAPAPEGDVVIARGQRVRVSAVMSREVACVTGDVTAETAADLLIRRGASGTAVVSRTGQLIGMISKTDLLRVQPGTSVAEVMTPWVFAVPGGTELSRAAALMVAEGVHQLPVISGDGVVEGILTTLDVVAWVARRGGYPTTDS